MSEQIAVFGAGCFWGVQSIFDATEGISETMAGYAGGDDKAWPDPTYRQTCTGRTGHTEIVAVRYDPDIISYQQLVDLYIQMHDPTDQGGQGPDRGSQYRSVILTTSKEQAELASARITQLGQASLWNKPIATEIAPLTTIWPAEDYHQHYFPASLSGHGCHWLRRLDLPAWPQAQ